jgi:hypothetical protein
MTTTPLLELSTLVERETILIRSGLFPDGKHYEVRNGGELDAIEYQTLESAHRSFVKIQEKGDTATSADARRVSELLRKIVLLIVPDLEPEVLDELGDDKRLQILDVWNRSVTRGAEGNAPGRLSTGGGSSRDSKPSTAATRRRGFASRWR